MKRSRFLHEALTELLAALDYYEERSPRARLDFEADLREVLAAVRTYPESGKRVTARHRQLLFSKFPFSLIYENAPDEIVIFAVTPQKRRRFYWRRRARRPG